MHDRDRSLIALLRCVCERTAKFIEHAEQDQLSDLEFAGNLVVLMRTYWDAAAQMRARAAALNAVNPWTPRTAVRAGRAAPGPSGDAA